MANPSLCYTNRFCRASLSGPALFSARRADRRNCYMWISGSITTLPAIKNASALNGVRFLELTWQKEVVHGQKSGAPLWFTETIHIELL